MGMNWFFIVAAILISSCSFINSVPIDTEDLTEHRVMNTYYPIYLSPYDGFIVERAAPRLGRAAPRLGRAAPRLGRQIGGVESARFDPFDRYYTSSDDIIDDIQASIHERRAAPRLGREIKFQL